MTYEEQLKKLAAEGAIRAMRLSDTTAYVYRFKDNEYQARTLTATAGDWQLAHTLASRRQIDGSPDGWSPVLGMPKRALPIDADEAKKNPGYTKDTVQQCYTCKQFKPESEFERSGAGGDPHRGWECNECYNRRQREVRTLQATSSRKGDFLDRDTLASPPPPQGKI